MRLKCIEDDEIILHWLTAKLRLISAVPILILIVSVCRIDTWASILFASRDYTIFLEFNRYTHFKWILSSGAFNDVNGKKRIKLRAYVFSIVLIYNEFISGGASQLLKWNRLFFNFASFKSFHISYINFSLRFKI